MAWDHNISYHRMRHQQPPGSSKTASVYWWFILQYTYKFHGHLILNFIITYIAANHRRANTLAACMSFCYGQFLSAHTDIYCHLSNVYIASWIGLSTNSLSQITFASWTFVVWTSSQASGTSHFVPDCKLRGFCLCILWVCSLDRNLKWGWFHARDK